MKLGFVRDLYAMSIEYHIFSKKGANSHRLFWSRASFMNDTNE